MLGRARRETAKHGPGPTIPGEENEVFWGRNTIRFAGLAQNSDAFIEIMLNPLVKEVADAFLEEVGTDYWMNTAQFIGIGPGEPAQVLHRDNDLWQRVCEWAWPKMPELSFNTLFPFHAVTDEMGATRVIPGSHRWNEKERRPDPAETVPAEMETGSAVFYSGYTFHGGGHNKTRDRWRYAVQMSFNAGWLTPERRIRWPSRGSARSGCPDAPSACSDGAATCRRRWRLRPPLGKGLRGHPDRRSLKEAPALPGGGTLMRIDFTDKRVLVTGGSRGIGRAIVEMFLAAGARVALNGSTEESTAKAVSEIDASGRLVAAPGSVAEVADCARIVEAAVAGLGGLDILINNAGWGDVTLLGETTEESWNRTVDTNLKGVYFMTQYAAPHLKATKGAIVNFSSVFGLVGAPGSSVYGAAKAGVINLTKAHALELAPDVRVNAVCLAEWTPTCCARWRLPWPTPSRRDMRSSRRIVRRRSE